LAAHLPAAEIVSIWGGDANDCNYSRALSEVKRLYRVMMEQHFKTLFANFIRN
jgi:hypothetical protein